MTARLYINGNDCGELNIENVYSVTHSEIVSSTLNKISIVVTANTYNSILDGNKPGKVNGTIATLAAGDMEFVQNVTIDSHNNWTAVVSGLPTKENDGEDIYYYVTEFSLYGYTISYQNNGVLAGVGGNPIVVINKADEKVKTASFSINKVDASTSTPQPLEGASFALYRAVKNDQNQFIRVGLPIATAISNASGTGVVFSGLIPGEYLLYETSAPTGYVTPSEPWRITVNNDCVVDAHGLQANSDGAYIIENGKYPGILSITKKVEGYEMEGGMHYYIKVTLTDAADKPLTGSFNGIRLENGSAIYELVKDAKKVTAADDWNYEFTELPAYSEDGRTAYTYTVDEESVAGYITTVSGTNLINTITGTTSVSGTKTWRVPEGTELPESITVILKRNDEPVARKKVTAADDWSYEFTELPAYSEDGSTAYTYTVEEKPVEGYITTVSGTNLINTITSVKISKVDIADGEELEGATIQLIDTTFELKEDGSIDTEKTTTTVSEEGVLLVEDTITSVKISKVDIADGEELEGATIQLIDKETGEVVEEWTSTNKAHEVTGLTTGKTYILRETVAPEGYSITSDTTFELKEDGSIDTEKTTTTVSEEGVLLVEDTRRIDFIVNKVSATDDHELYDTILSVYEITDEGEVLVDSWTSRWKEVHNFGLKLSCGKSYILREDKATGGYHKIPGDILFNVTADGKIQITEGQDWKYENGKNVIEEVVDEAGNVIYLIRDVRNPEEEEETEPDGPTDPHQSETTTPEETTTSEEETTPEETTTSEEETSPEETTVSEEETTVSEEETTLPSPDDEESTPEVTTPAANTTTTAAETTVSETPTTTPSSERVILGIEDMSRTIGMALAGFGAIMLTALIWLYLRSKKA